MKNSDENENIVIYGNDSDLIIIFLYLAYKKKLNIYIYHLTRANYISLQKFKDILLDQNIKILSYCFLTFLLGNDFLPSLIKNNNMKKLLSQKYLKYNLVQDTLVIDINKLKGFIQEYFGIDNSKLKFDNSYVPYSSKNTNLHMVTNYIDILQWNIYYYYDYSFSDLNTSSWSWWDFYTFEEAPKPSDIISFNHEDNNQNQNQIKNQGKEKKSLTPIQQLIMIIPKEKKDDIIPDVQKYENIYVQFQDFFNNQNKKYPEVDIQELISEIEKYDNVKVTKPLRSRRPIPSRYPSHTNESTYESTSISPSPAILSKNVENFQLYFIGTLFLFSIMLFIMSKEKKNK